MEENKKKYVSIPRNYVLNSDSLISKYKVKEIVYFHINLLNLRSRFSNVCCSINQLLFKMKWNKRSENVDKVRYMLECLIKEKIIKNIDSLPKSNSAFFDFTYEPDEDKYTLLDYDIYNKLLTGDRINYNKLNLYCYILIRSYTLPSGKVYYIENKFETCSPKMENFSESLDLNRKTVKKIVEELFEEELIYYENAGKYTVNDSIFACPNTYITCDKLDYKKQIDEAIKFFRNSSTERGFQWLPKKRQNIKK